MQRCLHFFASKQDLCNIFKAVEQEFSIKYCVTEAKQAVCKERPPRMEFDTIEEIADGFTAALFKSMVREIRKNCVRIKNTAPTYIGKELYRDRANRVFYGERCGAFTVTDGMRILLEQLHYIPEKGYHCGCEGIVKILLKGNHFEKFKTSLSNADRDTKAFVRKILDGLTNKKIAGRREELLKELF